MPWPPLSLPPTLDQAQLPETCRVRVGVLDDIALRCVTGTTRTIVHRSAKDRQRLLTILQLVTSGSHGRVTVTEWPRGGEPTPGVSRRDGAWCAPQQPC